MKKQNQEDKNSNHNLAIGLIGGFMVGVLLNNVVLGLLGGVVFGCFFKK